MKSLTMLASGLLFGAGLGLSGMTRPEKVIGFLDVTGRWDPSLMFVMMGAMSVHFVLRRAIHKHRATPLLDTKFHLPVSQSVDWKLVLGAIIFGMGWGLGGFCPGPAIVTLGSGSLSALVFVATMAIGMLLQHVVHNRA